MCQIYTIVSGVYAFFYEYFRDQILAPRETYNLSANNGGIKPLNFKESITLEIDHESMKNYEFETRMMLKLKILKCVITLHSPKVFHQLLELDRLEGVH